VADEVIRIEFVLGNAQAAYDGVEKLKKSVTDLGNTKATAQVDLDHQAAMTKIAQINNEIARLRATRANVEFDADTAPADMKLRALKDQTAELNATRTKMTVEADTSQASQAFADLQRQAALYQNETARMRAEKLDLTIQTNAPEVNQSLREITLNTQMVNQEISRGTMLKSFEDAAKGANDASKAVDNLGKSAKSTATSLDDATKASSGFLDRIGAIIQYSAGYQAFHAIEQGVTGTASAIIGMNDQLERAQIAFTHFLGSASAATDYLKQLQAFAANTPFQFADLTPLAQQMMGMGIAAKDVLPDLRAIGDAVAGVGGNADTLNRVVHAFAEIQSQGVVTERQLREMELAGISAGQYIAQALGVTTEQAAKMITAGKVSADVAMKAIVAGMNENFGGMMRGMMGTFTGMFSNLKDQFDMFAATLGKPFFAEVKSGVAELAQYLKSDQFQQLFGSMVSDATNLLHAIESLVAGFEKIPAPVLTTLIHVGELAVAFKTAEIALSGLRALFSPLLTILGMQTAATEAQTAATLEGAAANAAMAASEKEVAAAKGTEIAATEAQSGASAAGGIGGRLGKVAGGSILGRVGGAFLPSEMAGTGAAGGIGAGVIAGVAELFTFVSSTVGDAVDHQWRQAVQDAVTHAPGTPMAAITLLNDLIERLSGYDVVHSILGASGLLGLPDDIIKAASAAGHGATTLPVVGGVFSGIGAGASAVGTTAHGIASGLPGAGAVGDYFNQLGSLSRFLISGPGAVTTTPTVTSSGVLLPGPFQNIANQAGAHQVQALLDAVSKGQMTATDAEIAFSKLNSEFGGALTNAKELEDAFNKGLGPALQAYRDSVNGTTASLEQLRQEMKDAGQAQAVGASNEDVLRSVFGITSTGADATKEQVKAATQDINDLTKAWQDAQRAATSVNLSQGISGLAAAAPALDQAVSALQKLGQSDAALNNLKAISDQFKAITDATKAASSAYDGYLALFDDTDQRIKVLDDLTKKINDGVTAAKEAQKNGTITPEQQQLLEHYQTGLANIAAIRDKLTGAQAGDILGLGANVPDFEKIDTTTRNLTTLLGGPKQLELTVQSNIDQVKQTVDDLVNNPHKATLTIDIVTAIAGNQNLPPWLVSALGTAAGGSTAPPPPPPPAAGGAASGLSFDRWNQIIQAGSYTGAGAVTSPLLNNLDQFKSFMQGVQQSGIDPFIALAAMQAESNFGSNPAGIGTANTRINNYIGMGLASSPPSPYQVQGGSGVAAADYGPGNYAAFADLASQVEDLKRWISENNAGATSIPAMFAGYSTSSAAGGLKQTIYNQLTGGQAAQTITPDTGSAQPTTRVSLTQVTDNPVKGTNINVAAMQKRAQELAGVAYVYGGGHPGGPGGGFDCSGYVMEVMHAGGITVPWTDAGGLYKWAQTAEGSAALAAAGIELGFYNPGAGGENEHVAINVGGNWYESGGQRGMSSGPSPNAPKGLNAFVGTPAPLGSGGAGVYGPQTTGDRNATFDQAASNVLGSAGQGFGTSNIWQPTADSEAAAKRLKNEEDALTQSVLAVKAAQDQFNASLKGIDPQDVQEVNKQFSTLLPIMEKLENAKLPANADAAQQQTAINTAYAKTIDLTTTWGQALMDIRNQTGNLADDEAKLAQQAGPEMASALNEQLDAMNAIKQSQDTINALTQEKTDLENQYAQTQQQEQQADSQRQRQATLDQRAIQDQRTAQQQAWQDEQNNLQRVEQQRQINHQAEMNRLQDEQTAENSRYTSASRALQDQMTQLQHYGTAAKQALVDAQTALDTQYNNQTGARGAQTQLAQATARSGQTNASAQAAAAVLATIADAQATADENYKKQTDNNKLLQAQQDRAASEQLYQLQLQSTAAQRAHEDAMTNIAAQSTAAQRAFDAQTNQLNEQNTQRQIDHQSIMNAQAAEDTARQRASEDEQYNISQQRQQEQLAYQQQSKNIDAQITAQQKLVTDENTRLTNAQTALSTWQQVDDKVNSAGQNFLTLIDNAASAASSGGGTSLPTKASGGYVSGMAIVGDSPSGDLSSAEVVSGNFTVYSHAQSVARGFIPGSGLTRYVNGSGAPSSGDTYQLTFNASGNRQSDEEMFQKLQAWVQQRDRAGEINVRRNSLAARQAAQGAPRY
jgi:tape measure domain-containing protein